MTPIQIKPHLKAIALDHETDVAKLESVCLVCKQVNTLEIPFSGLQKWHKFGLLIQDTMPSISDDTKEQLISGTCPSCFEKLFGTTE